VTYNTREVATVQSVPISGGSGSDLYQLPDDLSYPAYGVLPIAWSPDGTHMLLQNVDNDSEYGIVDLDITTGATRMLRPESIPELEGASYSPDGSMVAFSTSLGNFTPAAVTVIAFVHGTTTTYSDIDEPADGEAGGVSFSPDGNGVVYQSGASLVERRLPDPKGDVRPDDPDVKTLGPAPPTSFSSGGIGDNLAFDVQAQQLPIVFLPGVMGSTIRCNGKTVWLTALGALTKPDLAEIALKPGSGSPDGVVNADSCPSARADGSLISLAHGLLQKALKALKLPPGAGGGTFPVYLDGWVWRHAPSFSIDRLQQIVQDALGAAAAEGRRCDQGRAVRPFLRGTARANFLDGHADEVSRILAAGTPYWGSPKVVFSLAFGVFNPLSSEIEGTPASARRDVLNYVLDHTELNRVSQNLAGLFELAPSERKYGP
jgi:hypothetical protein